MRELLEKISLLEDELDEAQMQAEYWLDEEHFDEQKAENFEKKADAVYEELYAEVEKASTAIVKFTSGAVDKKTATIMLRTKRSEIERLFA